MIIAILFIISFILMFWFENKIAIWWLRLPFVNILTFIFIIIMIIIEEIYLTFHPKERSKWIKTSWKQHFFD